MTTISPIISADSEMPQILEYRVHELGLLMEDCLVHIQDRSPGGAIGFSGTMPMTSLLPFYQKRVDKQVGAERVSMLRNKHHHALIMRLSDIIVDQRMERLSPNPDAGALIELTGDYHEGVWQGVVGKELPQASAYFSASFAPGIANSMEEVSVPAEIRDRCLSWGSESWSQWYNYWVKFAQEVHHELAEQLMADRDAILASTPHPDAPDVLWAYETDQFKLVFQREQSAILNGRGIGIHAMSPETVLEVLNPIREGRKQHFDLVTKVLRRDEHGGFSEEPLAEDRLRFAQADGDIDEARKVARRTRNSCVTAVIREAKQRLSLERAEAALALQGAS